MVPAQGDLSDEHIEAQEDLRGQTNVTAMMERKEERSASDLSALMLMHGQMSSPFQPCGQLLVKSEKKPTPHPPTCLSAFLFHSP